MSDFKAKMHQTVCRLGLRPRPFWELTALPQTPSWILGPKGRGGKSIEKGREGKEGKGG